MAAGLGFKTFTTGEVLTAADTNGYLMQGILVFASAAARDAAITSPQEGQFAYLKDTNVTTYYTGSAWANVDTTGMTNPMTTTGDTIYSSSGSTPARLGIGTANQQLRVNSGATAPEWFTPAAASGGMTLISTTTLSGASTTITVAANSYVNLVLIIKSIESAGDVEAYFQLDGFTGATDYTPLNIIRNPNGPVFASRVTGTNGVMLSSEDVEGLGTNNNYVGYCTIYDANSSIAKLVDCNNFYVHNSGRINGNRNLYTFASTSAVASIVFSPVGSTWDGGTILLYGVK
jgi:hypothetical protein